jgi:hypothetical protein
VLAKIGLDLPLQGGDLLVQRGQDGDQRADRGGICRGHDVRLAQVSGAQYSLDLPGAVSDAAAAGTLEGCTELH